MSSIGPTFGSESVTFCHGSPSVSAGPLFGTSTSWVGKGHFWVNCSGSESVTVEEVVQVGLGHRSGLAQWVGKCHRHEFNRPGSFIGSENVIDRLARGGRKMSHSEASKQAEGREAASFPMSTGRKMSPTAHYGPGSDSVILGLSASVHAM